MSLSGAVSECLSPRLEMCHELVASVDATIAIVALVQLARIYFQNPTSKWSRQKVFHVMVFFANSGYFIFFSLTPWAACNHWSCWNHVCGFTLLAVPQIIFLATFLLLLSFWVDLCHQATDKEEEEEEDSHGQPSYIPVDVSSSLENGNEAEIIIQTAQGSGDAYLEQLLGGSEVKEKSPGCWSAWREIKVRGRQKIVVAAVSVICVLTGLFALLIWIGLGDNNIDPQLVARVHADVFAVAMLLSGGGLAFYGLLLFSKLSRLRAGKASEEISKVAWLAGICLFCFSLRAFIVLEKSIPFLSVLHFRGDDGNLLPLWFSVYYLIGEALPSAVVLLILKDMPARSRDNSHYGAHDYTVIVARLEEAEASRWLLPGSSTATPPSSTDAVTGAGSK